MNTTLEALVRNLAVSVEGLRSTVEGHSTRLDETRQDAREARDATTKLTERLTTQDMPAEIAKLRAAMDAGFIAARSDLTVASSHTNTAISDLSKRVDELENWRERLNGASGLVGWLSRNAPWLVTLVAVLGAYFHLLPQKLP